jgi:hypothetical protein
MSLGLKRARHYTCRGQTATLREWSSLTGVPVVTIKVRLHRGWTFEEAIKR